MIEKLVTVKRSKRAKRVALRLDTAQGIINLVVPDRMPLKKAYDFARNHEEWIHKTLEKIPGIIEFTHGATLPIFGDSIKLDITVTPTLKRTTIKQQNDVLFIKTYQENPTTRIAYHLKKIARAGLSDLASDKADMIEKKIKTIHIRETKSQWGSCAQNNNISFSWRLIFAPYHAADYVVAHEVAHLIHMNHSREFWALCEKLCLDYTSGKRWMKQNGPALMRYG